MVTVYIKREEGVEPMTTLKNHRAYREVIVALILTHGNIIRYYESWIEMPDDDQKAKEKVQWDNFIKLAKDTGNASLI